MYKFLAVAVAVVLVTEQVLLATEFIDLVVVLVQALLELLLDFHSTLLTHL
jgi:hypothetical protein